MDRIPDGSATAPLADPHPAELARAGGGVTRRALGVAGAGAAGAVMLSAGRASAASAATAAASPDATSAVDASDAASTLTLSDAQVGVVAAVARAMASVPVALPYRVGRDPHPLDRVTDARIRALAGHLTPAQAVLTRKGADVLAAAGVGSARPAAIASAIAAHDEWDASAEVDAVLQLAAATATPLGFGNAFPSAWRALLRTRQWPAIAPAGKPQIAPTVKSQEAR